MEEKRSFISDKPKDDTSSTEDEEIRLVLDDALDEVEKDEEESKNEPKSAGGGEAEAPCSPITEDISFDKITSNFDDDSNASFDRTLDNKEEEKTESAVASEISNSQDESSSKRAEEITLDEEPEIMDIEDALNKASGISSGE
jgi:hypothetical protein